MSTAEPHRDEPLSNQKTRDGVTSYSNLLQGVARATHQLLTAGDYTTAIDRALATLGQVTCVDRVYVFEFHPHPETGELAHSQRFEWVRETVTPQIDNPQLQNLTPAAIGTECWYESLQAGRTMSGSLRDFPTPTQQLLASQGIQSILIVPIPVGGKLWGFIGFDDCQKERHWSADEAAVLTAMAATLGGAIAHRQTEDALRQSERRLQDIAARVPGTIFQFRQRPDGSCLVLYISCGCRELFELEPEAIQANCRSLLDLMHPSDRDTFEQSMAASAATGATWSWEGRVTTPSDQCKWIRGASRLERQTNGDLLWDGLLVDITDRKHAEEALRASEGRLRSFFDATFEAVLIHDRGMILDLNTAAETLFGYTKAELIDRSVLEITAPCSQALIQSRIQAPADEPLEAIGLKKDGTTFIAEVSAKSIRYQGRSARVVGIRDITARKQAEDSLRQSEARNRAFLQAIPDLIFRMSRDGVFLDCKAEKASDLVMPADDLIGKKLDEVLPSSLAQTLMEQIESALVTGTIQTQEYELPLRDEPHYWEARLVVCGEDEVLAIVRNITERKQAERERLLSAERDRLLAQIALRIRQSLDLEQILQTAVAEVRQFLECDRVFFTHFDQACSRGNLQCVLRSDSEALASLRASGTSELRTGKAAQSRSDGSWQEKVSAESVAPEWGSVLKVLQENPAQLQELNAQLAATPIQVISDTTCVEVSPQRAQYFRRHQVKACLGVQIIVGDRLFGVLVAHQCDRPRQWQPFEVNCFRALATQVAIAIQQAQLYQQVQALNTNLERQVEERTQQLKQKYAELQELHRLKDVFLHAVSHDLRTPVLGWLMVLKNLLNQPEATISVSRSVLERMVQSSDRQLRLINSLLEVHASEVVGVVPKRQPLQLRSLLREVVEDLTPLVAKNQVKLVNRVPADLPAISADPELLRRVYENLMTNAFNHNPPGIRLTLDARVEGDTIRCTVADNGVGMTQQLCDRLFQLYAKGQDARSLPQGYRPYTGLGLGLYLCRQIITAHGGKIGVNSRPGKGTTFWFTLPIAAGNVGEE